MPGSATSRMSGNIQLPFGEQAYIILYVYIYNDFSIIISNSYLSLIDIFFIRAVAVLAFQYFEDS